MHSNFFNSQVLNSIPYAMFFLLNLIVTFNYFTFISLILELMSTRVLADVTYYLNKASPDQPQSRQSSSIQSRQSRSTQSSQSRSIPVQPKTL